MTDQVHVHDDDVISSDEAEAVNVVAQRAVGSGMSVATQIPSRTRRGVIVGSPCNGSSLSRETRA